MRAAPVAAFAASLLVTSLADAGGPKAKTKGASAAPAAPAVKVEGAAIVRGAGRVKRDGSHEWTDTTTGAVVMSGATLEASAQQPLELMLPDGVTISLEPGCSVRWMPQSKLPSETNSWVRGYHLVLREGELDVRMPQASKGSHAFLVSTKAGTLTDWRGKLHVMVHEDTTAAAIYEGALVVGSNGQGFPVYDGAGILMRKGHDPDKTRIIPSAPKWDGAAGGGTPSFAVVQGTSKAPLGFAWAKVEGAASYRVEIATEATMVRVVHRGTIPGDPRYTLPELPALPPGARYYAHVRAVSDDGIVGEWSPARALRVVHYQVPDGAIVATDGVIVLPDGASVAMSDADGIDVAYENVQTLARRPSVPLYWAKLSGPIRLADDAPIRIAHLRDATLGAEAQIVVARRSLRASVEMLPHNARWPNDPIDVRVVVADPSGRIDAAHENVSLEATLGLDPLAVPWQHAGAVWTGRIAPRAASGPNVVRVVAKDGRGQEIGRGFVEIDGPAAHAMR